MNLNSLNRTVLIIFAVVMISIISGCSSTKESSTSQSILGSGEEKLMITATTGSHGTISPSGEIVVDKYGTTKFTITPETGYTVDSVIVDGMYVGKVTNYTFTRVTANHIIRTSFVSGN